MEKPYDLAIIGAGMVGASTAILARKTYPDWRIALLDASLAGHGTTLYSASLDIPFGHTPMRRALAVRSQVLFEEFVRDFPEINLQNLKVYAFAKSINVESILQQFVIPGVKIGDEEDWQVLKRQFPEFQTPQQALLISAGKRATDNFTAHKLSRIASAHPNTVLMEGHFVQKILKKDRIFLLQSSQSKKIAAERVILATGPWISSGPDREQIAEMDIRVKKVIAFHIPVHPQLNDPVFYFFDDEAFLLPQQEARQWLFSYRSNHWDVKPGHSNLRISWQEKRQAMEVLGKYFPRFAGLCQSGRVFCDGYTTTGDPVIKKIPGVENYVVAGACAGSGFRLGPGIAEKALELLDT